MSERRRIAGENRPGAPERKPRRKPSPARGVGRPAGKRVPTERRQRTDSRTGAVLLSLRRSRRDETQRDAREAEPRSRPTGRTIVILAACLVVAVAGVGFGLWKGGAPWGADSVPEAHRAAAKQAGEDVVTVFSYQYDSLDQHLSDAKALMTDSFADKFEEISPALSELAPKNKVRVKATTRKFAPMDCGDACSENKASVLVFMDQARTQGSGEPTVFGNRIIVDMVRDDGGWLIDDIRTL